jgi:hypothetical protein
MSYRFAKMDSPEALGSLTLAVFSKSSVVGSFAEAAFSLSTAEAASCDSAVLVSACAHNRKAKRKQQQ